MHYDHMVVTSCRTPLGGLGDLVGGLEVVVPAAGKVADVDGRGDRSRLGRRVLDRREPARAPHVLSL